MNEKYIEIIDMPHHVSPTRAPMSRHDRAAQFAPYSALSGYEDAVDETARITEGKRDLDEYEKERINATLQYLLTASADTKVKMVFFRPDKHKDGGSYITVVGEVGCIDEHRREITLIGGLPISIDDILELEEIDS